MIEYPARFKKEERFFFCRFIDFPDIAFTQGLTMDELKENARDVYGVGESDREIQGVRRGAVAN